MVRLRRRRAGRRRLAPARGARGAGELEHRRELNAKQASGAAERAGDGGAGLGGGAGQDGLGAGVVEEVGELAGVGADVVIGDVAEPTGAAGEIGGRVVFAGRTGGVRARGLPGAFGEAVQEGGEAGMGAGKAGASQEEAGHQDGGGGEDGEVGGGGQKVGEGCDAQEEGEEDGFQARDQIQPWVGRVVVCNRCGVVPCPCHG